MSPQELVDAYMAAFYDAFDPEALERILAPQLAFNGPFLRCRDADTYLAALRADPPAGMQVARRKMVCEGGAVRVDYLMLKAGKSVPMSQRFRVRGERIVEIELRFDPSALL